MALMPQTKLGLVALAGDVKQLGPTLLSHQASRNTLRNVTIGSMMQHLLQGCPWIESMELCVNHRGYPTNAPAECSTRVS